MRFSLFIFYFLFLFLFFPIFISAGFSTLCFIYTLLYFLFFISTRLLHFT